MYYILNCTFDICANHLFIYEIDHETEKCYYAGANTGRVSKKDMNKVILHRSGNGSYWGEIYVATYSKPEDIDSGIELINKIKTEFLLKTTSNMVTRSDIGE